MPNAPEALLEHVVNAGWSAIEEMVSAARSETLHLDFKRKQRPQTAVLDSDDRRNLAEALSGFANSEGGILVWGVDARRQGDHDHAIGIHPIADCRRFASELAQAVPDLVSPVPTGVRHIPIPAPSPDGSGAVITIVPESDATPHMGRAKSMHRYYRRSESGFRPLEHYEVADLFGRRAHPKLTATARWDVQLSQYDGAGSAKANFNIRLRLRNEGRAIARYPAITVGRPSGYEPDDRMVRFGSMGMLREALAPDGWWFRLIGGADVVVYPDDEFEAGYITIVIHNRGFEYRDIVVPFRAIAADVAAANGELRVPAAEIEQAASNAFRAQGLDP